MTSERDARKMENALLRKQRLEEFMIGFSTITTKLKEMYQVGDGFMPGRHLASGCQFYSCTCQNKNIPLAREATGIHLIVSTSLKNPRARSHRVCKIYIYTSNRHESKLSSFEICLLEVLLKSLLVLSPLPKITVNIGRNGASVQVTSIFVCSKRIKNGTLVLQNFRKMLLLTAKQYRSDKTRSQASVM